MFKQVENYLQVIIFDIVTTPGSYFINTIDLEACHSFPWVVIAHSYPNFNGGLDKPPLKLGYGWTILLAAYPIRHCLPTGPWWAVGACEKLKDIYK